MQHEANDLDINVIYFQYVKPLRSFLIEVSEISGYMCSKTAGTYSVKFEALSSSVPGEKPG